VEGTAVCTECSTPFETRFPLAELLALSDQGPATAQLEVDGLRIVVRAPSADQVSQLAQTHGPVETLRQALIGLCVVSCTDGAGTSVEVPVHAHGRIAAAVESLDPLAAVSIHLSCPDCGAELDLNFDPAEFVWTEVDTAARHLLWEVDQIARVYHWRESDILAMSPARRRTYLGMVLG
jgi:hypothetical protein